ncbi:ABC transporter ATP-binding protein [Desulfosediminicola flagellatus]|uniref:ABC transporter ATP-binding protein n=1 Tax=Desulfosediminicola flagellatus TaxID=2569541 RepID=UPI001593DA1A|nr:ABC transporter ATP-binding protein [Desulfosediminicola flagellatus]
MVPLLDVRNLKKVYKDTVAVHDVSFSVDRGVCLGLLGPNGAGKTTTIEIVEDIIPATSGTIYYKGSPRTASFREEIGIQFQHTSLLNYLSVEETLKSFHKLFAHPVDIEPLIKRCDLCSLRKRKNDKLSGGQLQRLMLALALINDPDLIFLDEPSTGLDPQSRHNLWQIVEQIKDEGKTIILTTHSMEEAQHLCDEIAIMDSGLIIAQGSPRELIETHCKTSTLSLPANSFDGIENTSELAAKLHWEVHDGNGVIYTDSIDRTLKLLTSNNIQLSGMNIHTPTLEDVFLHLTGKTLRD